MAEAEAYARKAARRDQIRTAVRNAIPAEADDSVTLLSRLETRLLALAADPGFLQVPLQQHIERLRRDLGLPVTEPAPPQAEGPEPPTPWRSSA